MSGLVAPLPVLPTALPSNIHQRQAFQTISSGNVFINPVASHVTQLTGLFPAINSNFDRFSNYDSYDRITPESATHISTFTEMLGTTGTLTTNLNTFLNHTNISSGVNAPPSNSTLLPFSSKIGLASSGMKLDATHNAGGDVCSAAVELFASILEGPALILAMIEKLAVLAAASLQYVIQEIQGVINFINAQIAAMQALIQREIQAALNYITKIANAAITQTLEDLLGNTCTAFLVQSIISPAVVSLLQSSRAVNHR